LLLLPSPLLLLLLLLTLPLLMTSSSFREKAAATAAGLRTVRFTVARASSDGVATKLSTPGTACGRSAGRAESGGA